MSNDNKILSKNLKYYRFKHNFSQETLAEKLQLSTRYISQLERGIAFGSATTLVNLCNALDINIDFLFRELINCEIAKQSETLDDEFYNNYMQLNFHHRNLINMIVTDMLKLQSTENKKKMNE